MSKKRIPIGISNFEKLITNNYYFVDKSLFIKEVFVNTSEVTLIPRPRRFGKTLNLSMLQYFFENRYDKKEKKYLFDNLNISKEKDVMEHQGKYPVIYITFKEVKKLDWSNCYSHLKEVVSQEYRRHKYLLKSNLLDLEEKNIFQEIIAEKDDIKKYENALKNLSFYRSRYYKKKVIILIDEYDTPIHAGYIYKYYEQVISFMRGFLGAGLKDNINLNFSVITGILRVAKESIFSGLNNLEVATILQKQFSDKFGFLENETQALLKEYKLEGQSAEVESWYNGYNFGGNTIYNPWSILNFVKRKGEFSTYWINTSSNDIIRDIIETGNNYFKKNLEEFINGKTIEKHIDENIVFQNVKTNLDTLWSFLLFSGYLKYTNKKLIGDDLFCDLEIPNSEIRSCYKRIILQWIECGLDIGHYQSMLKSLTEGDIAEFRSFFTHVAVDSLSFFDISGKEPESFFHAFVLGMLVSLGETHQIKSNRESGYGRYDVMVIPRDKNKLGIIIEFKKVDKTRNETLEIAAKNALKQIEEKKYEQELLSIGIKDILKLAIIFEGKKVLIKEY